MNRRPWIALIATGTALAALSGGAASASAASLTLSVPPTARTLDAVEFTSSGTADRDSDLISFIDSSGTCAATAAEEANRLSTANATSDGRSVRAGNFSFREVFQPTKQGNNVLCAYLSYREGQILVTAATASAPVAVSDTAPTFIPPTIENDSQFSMPYDDVVRLGVPFQCGKKATTRGPAVACRVELKASVPAKVASFLGLSSRALADGVAGSFKDRFTDSSDETTTDRTYFLPISSAVKSKLKARKVGAIGVRITGRISIPGLDRVYCASEYENDKPTQVRASCPIEPKRKALVYGGQDGELLCWRYMPWWLATPATWGKMCPRPITTS